MLIAALDRAGVRRLFLSPGARSAPLACAAAGQPGWEVVTHFDERGAAFAALGAAQAGGIPCACLTTSGSAAGHLFPAVIEASESGIPLVLLTADRPPRLRGTGANQTILQPGIFGSYTRSAVDLPVPGELEPARLIQLLEESLTPLREEWAGPVHWNVPLEEPLLPEEESGAPPPQEHDPSRFFSHPAVADAKDSIDAASLSTLRNLCQARRGVLVVGELSPQEQRELAGPLAQLAGHLGWPLLADPLSGLRGGVPGVIHHTDLLLQTKGWPQPEAILHVGGRLVARRLQEWLARVPGSAWGQIRRGPPRLDPALVEPFCRLGGIGPIVARLRQDVPAAWSTEWREAWQAADRQAAQYLEKAAVWPGEPALAREVFSLARTAEAAVFLGNSMPVRDVDTFVSGEPEDPRVLVFGQRGASGIDGNIAHIAGIAGVIGQPVFGLLGDLATLHDLNSFPLLAGHRVVLFVPNNGGGGIFSFLPMHLPAADRERLLATPHGLCLASLAAPFGVRSRRCQAVEEIRSFVAEVLDPSHPPGPALVEIPGDRAENLAQHRQITQGWVAQAAPWRPAFG
jgi:2-succinyl-5-enolpyruvyl-6-hydroxy-3-cyclohexene-1-carboxylate synthase